MRHYLTLLYETLVQADDSGSHGSAILARAFQHHHGKALLFVSTVPVLERWPGMGSPSHGCEELRKVGMGTAPEMKYLPVKKCLAELRCLLPPLWLYGTAQEHARFIFPQLHSPTFYSISQRKVIRLNRGEECFLSCPLCQPAFGVPAFFFFSPPAPLSWGVVAVKGRPVRQIWS